jgi:DNA repair protein RAD50
MPPNTKGGAFIHDPSVRSTLSPSPPDPDRWLYQIACENEVKAEVKLRFFNTNRAKMVAGRRLQVTKRKTAGLTMKTLEGTLAYADEQGDKTKVSHFIPSFLVRSTERVDLATGPQYPLL